MNTSLKIIQDNFTKALLEKAIKWISEAEGLSKREVQRELIMQVNDERIENAKTE